MMILLIDDFSKAKKMQQIAKKSGLQLQRVSVVDQKYFKVPLVKADLIVLTCAVEVKEFLQQYEKLEFKPQILALDFQTRQELLAKGIEKILPSPLDSSVVNLHNFIKSVLPLGRKVLFLGDSAQLECFLQLKDSYVVDFITVRARSLNCAKVTYLKETLCELSCCTVVLLDVVSAKEFFLAFDNVCVKNCQFACLSPQVAQVCLDNGFDNFVIANDFNVIGLLEKILANQKG